MTGVLIVFIVLLLTVIAGQGAAVHRWISRTRVWRERALSAEQALTDRRPYWRSRDESLWEKEMQGGDQ